MLFTDPDTSEMYESIDARQADISDGVVTNTKLLQAGELGDVNCPLETHHIEFCVRGHVPMVMFSSRGIWERACTPSSPIRLFPASVAKYTG